MWIMLLIAVHVNNPQDQPGRVELEFPDQATCERVLATMTYQLKFSSFQVKGRCEPRNNTVTNRVLNTFNDVETHSSVRENRAR